MDIIGVLDVAKEKVLWTWGRGYLELSHLRLKKERTIYYDVFVFKCGW